MTIETLKTELREFIALSETITPGEWECLDHEAYPSLFKVLKTSSWRQSIVLYATDVDFEEGGRRENSFRFIARSRNISPTMAKGWLEVIETLDDMPFNVADALETKLLKLWEETK